jgi:hypothetical protein
MVFPENCPVKTIVVKDLVNAIEIKHILKGYGRLVYEFYTLTETLKYGESADEPDGERIYRQLSQFSGWPTQPSPNAAGRDILDVISKRPELTKNDLAIRVWDLSDIPCQNPYSPHKETLDIEGELIKRHIEQYDRAPIGNKQEQKRLDRGVAPVKHNKTVAPGLINKLFYGE